MLPVSNQTDTFFLIFNISFLEKRKLEFSNVKCTEKNEDKYLQNLQTKNVIISKLELVSKI